MRTEKEGGPKSETAKRRRGCNRRGDGQIHQMRRRIQAEEVVTDPSNHGIEEIDGNSKEKLMGRKNALDPLFDVPKPVVNDRAAEHF